jgi:hypothetical protein
MLAVLTACSADPSASYIARDPCEALVVNTADASPLELDGITAALALWRDHGVSAFDAPMPADAGGPIAIRFGDAAETFHGVYDPPSATITINRALTDRAALAIVIAHELGHVFGLSHIAAATRASLMNPGNLATPPTDADQRTLEALWGTCPGAARGWGAARGR